MKKLLLLGAAVAGLTTAQAQITVHPRAEVGVNVANLSMHINEVSIKTSAIAGLRIGGAAEIALPANIGSMTTLYVAPGLLYRHLGASKNDQQTRIQALTVPVNLGLRVGLDNHLALSLEAGPNFSYLLSAKEPMPNSTSIELNLLEKNEDGDALLKRFEAGFGVSAALEYNKFFVRVGGDFGLSNLINKSQLKDSSIKNSSAKTSDFHIGVGYRF